MRSALRPLAACSLLAACTFAVQAADAAGAPSAEPEALGFVWIEGNVGAASGGHAALRLGDAAFDYQLEPGGVLRLLREPWPAFVRRYATLQNRPLHVAYVRLEADDARRALDGFTREYLLQSSRVDETSELRRDAELAEAWAAPAPRVALPVAGLFAPTPAPRGADRRGEDPAPGLPPPASLDAALAAAAARGDLRRARELLLERHALALLRDERPLAKDACVDLPGPGLSPDERRTLSAFARAQARRIAELAHSARPDRGRAMLLAAARRGAALRSLREGRALWLDAMPETAPALEAEHARRRRAELEALAHRHADAYARVRRELLEGGGLDEAGVARLEELASRTREYARGAQGHPVREPRGRIVPARPARVAAGPPLLPPERLLELAARARAAAEAARADLARDYDYQILQRNCATELVRTLQDVLGGPEEASRALGGTLRPGEAATFIPFRLHDEVVGRFGSVRVERVPGWRERALAALRAEAPSPWWRAREATTLTSAVYTHRERDSSFLLFTDGVLWRRPLYGVANLTWALGDGAVGLVTAPFDRGRRLLRAGYGAFYSLPELVFLNIRKGTFDEGTLPAPTPTSAPTGPAVRNAEAH